MAIKISKFSKIKSIIERQLLDTLDFLYTDNQIDEIEVVKISRIVISDIDTTSTTDEIFKNLRVFVDQYPLFRENIQKTITALNKSYVS